MTTVNALSEVAALMGDPARAAMLSLLMDGRAHTASELALTAGITAQTASGHLGRMVDGNLLAARAQGRNRFYRLASSDVAHAIESLMAVAGTRGAARLPDRGVAARSRPALLPHLLRPSGGPGRHRRHRCADPRRPYRAQGPRDWTLTESGELFCQRIGVDVPGARRAGSRHFARQCLDWSERRPHISGALGAAIADTFFRQGWAERLRRSRTVRLTDSGRRALGSHFGAAV